MQVHLMMRRLGLALAAASVLASTVGVTRAEQAASTGGGRTLSPLPAAAATTTAAMAPLVTRMGATFAEPSVTPAAGALRLVPGFEEPLVATRPAGAAEAQALERLLAGFDPNSAASVAGFQSFLAQYPDSGWRLALQTNLGLWYYREGYFSKAIAAWEDAWAAGEAQPGLTLQAKALADRAVGELIRMHARLGHSQRLRELLAAVEGRTLVGPATELVAGAKQGVWMMDNDPGIAYLCGPNALRKLALLNQRSDAPAVKLLERYRSGERGVSLAQVGELARAAKLPYKPMFREGKAPIPVPSVVHWKVSHYAAIVAEDKGRYHIQDPTFGTDLWVGREAVEAESSGYFLIADGTPRAGWRTVSAAEADRIYGMGFTNAGDPNATRPDDPKANPDCGNGGMCGYNVHSLNVSLNITDTPVGYRPAVGPAVMFTLTYNQREARQPAVATFGNFGPKWTSNWLAYVVDVPNRPGVNVMSYVRGGGAYDEQGYSTRTGKFSPEASNYSVLRLVSASPVRYERSYRDGSVEVYASPDAATFYPRRVFLSQVLDPQGNAVTLGYDASFRLTTLTDAVGRVSTLTYGSAAFPLQPTKVTDPFGRFATINYDASGRLLNITDVIGLTSAMTYDAGSFITKLTTPYGDSTFAYTESGPDRSLTATDPLGYTERVESKQSAPGMPFSDPRGMPAGMDNDNQYLYYRNTFYWNKHVYALAAGDYTKARVHHWYHDLINFSNSSAAMASMQEPLEGRVWLRTPNDSGLTSGTYNQPRQVGRVLDDGSSQVTNILYNKTGNVAAVTDPVGRYTQYQYAPGGIDVTRIRQRDRTGTYFTLAQYTYNSQHLPLSATDAAGQVSQFTYNAAGQILTQTNALGEQWKYEYDVLGQLTRVVNPKNNTASSFTYDSAGRVATRTDSDGRTVSMGYDAMDRLTTVTYPDGTTEQLGYNRLDLASYKDRLNRVTNYAHDANRNLTGIVDPLLRSTSFTYYPNGAVQTMTDAKGQQTSWQRDLQGRLISKTHPDTTVETFVWETYGGRLLSQTDASGRSQTYTRLRDDRIARVAYGGGTVAAPAVSFSYDPVYPRLAAMVDGNGTTRYQYGAVGALGALQVTSEDGPFANDDISYTYDALGRVKQRSVAGSVESVVYDSLGRVTSGVNALGNLSYTYRNDTSQLVSQAVGANAKTTFAYEANLADRRLKSITNLGTRSFSYTTNAHGLVTSIVDTNLATPPVSRTWTPTYDAADRQTAMSLSTGELYQYAYDDANNITSFRRPSGTVAATYGAANQLTKLGTSVVTQDAAGNTLDDGKRTYQWDAAGRLASIGYKTQPTLRTDFKYDGLGRRTAIVETSGSTVTETRYLWCGTLLCQQRDGADLVTRRYFEEGETRTATSTRNYYNRDHIGSVRNVTGVATGAVVGSLDYDDYGNLLASTGNAGATDFRFAGMFYHGTSGLYLTRYRPYDPSSARWLSRDPIAEGGGTNLYSYVAGNPLNATDSSGLIIDTLADIGFIAYDIYSLIRDGRCGLAGNLAALGADVAGAVLPGVTGLGLAVRAEAKAAEVVAKEVKLSRALHGEAALHAEDAIRAGHPDVLTIDRAGAKANRQESIGGLDKVPGKHLDEYPPAMFKEGGAGASVRPISPRDNMSAGACVGNACRGLPDGTKIRITIGD